MYGNALLKAYNERMQRLKVIPPLTAILVALAGCSALAEVLVIRVHHHMYGHFDDSLVPISTVQSSRLLVLCTGILLLYLAVQIWRRKRLAWQLVTAGLVVLLAAELLAIRNVFQIALYVILLGFLVSTRTEYNVESSNLSLRRGAVVSAAIIGIVFLYATVGFATLTRHEIVGDISLPTAARYAAREIFTFQETQAHLRSRHARWFVASVDAASVLAYTLVIFSLFRPLRFQYGPTRAERERAREILRRYSTDTEDFFKLWPPDKHFFFSRSGNAFIAYKLVGSDALVLGSPSGDPADYKAVVYGFETYAARNGWTPSYVYADDGLGALMAEEYDRLFIGNEAVLSVEIFASETFKDKHFRYVRNKSERDGLQFEYWPRPLTHEQLSQLEVVSDAWLTSGGRREYTYAMGYFDRQYLQESDAAVLTRDGNVVAYANLVPILGDSPNRSIDHMRYRPGIASTGMHYLLMQLILRLHESGVKGFNLGLVPLSGIEERVDATIAERLLAVLKKVGARYYSSEGLEQFKNKFDPQWQPRYLYYQGPAPRLIKIAGSLNRAISLPVAGRWLKRLLIGLSVVAAVSNCSFLLSFLLDPDNSLTGFISELGAAGHPYAGLYNGLDILSSVIILGVLGYMWLHFNEETRRYRQPLLFLAAAYLGSLLAAAAPLPHSVTSGWLQFGFHGLYSTMDFIGVGLAGLWFALRRRHWWLWSLLGIYGITLTGWTLSWLPPVGPALEGINILASSALTVTLIVYLTGVIKQKIRV